MASTSLCCAASSRVVSGPFAGVRPSVSCASSGVSFGLGRRNHALSRVRVSTPRRSVCLEQSFRRLSIRAEAEAGEVDADARGPVPPTPPSPALRKKSRNSVKAGRKQRVVLRFLWLEKNIGISLDQVVPGHGIIPLSPYFFWPRKDAWEELKAKLDSKRWISRKTTIILLNQATDIINLWQQNATNLL